ncbi:MAG TPA: hypothetical protein VG247_21110 [Pseudonocardiaceae bacterium]|jgi:hypothetical protein|nr:hypothetical protein [Pseudonocardiaceae bacterium]
MINILRLAPVESTDVVVDQFVPCYDDLLDELKKLRKGRGIFAVDIERRVGPTLRRVAGIDNDDGPAEVRSKIARRLHNLVRALPDDLRIAALTAFAIASDARQPLYKDRVALTASRIGRDPRTARRRMDDAIVQLAQVATARPDQPTDFTAPATTDWYFTELVVSLILDRDRPEIVERGRIVAEADDVTEVALHADRMLGFAAAEHVIVDREVLYGGSLDQQRGPADARRTPLVLARPLEPGRPHEYVVQERILSRRALRPEVVFVPAVRCDRLVLRVRFPRTDNPIQARRLGGLADRVAVDAFGELEVEFRDLAAGRPYGVRWQWPELATPYPRPPVGCLVEAGASRVQLCAPTSSRPRQIPAITPITRQTADTFTSDATEQSILIAALPSSSVESGRRFHAGRGPEDEIGVATAPIALATGNTEN